MFSSSICKHINKWGVNKGNICGKSSRKKDSRCHKHRYRFLQFLNKIYVSFKYLFYIKPNTITNKKQIKKLLEKKENNDFQNKLDKEILKVYKTDIFSDYVDRIDNHTKELLKTNDKKIVHKLIIDKLYNILNTNYRMGTREWTNNANLILRIQKKYDFF
jgi:hypothetical protein